MFKSTIYLLLFLFLMSSCTNQEKRYNENNVRVLLFGDPESLNPLNSTGLMAGHISRHLYQPLIHVDKKTSELVPVLVNSVPQLDKDESGKWFMEMTLRKEAKWDDGTPILAKDVLFSLKLLKLPLLDNASLKPYFEKVEDIALNKDDPRIFRVYFKETYIQMVWCLPDLLILPSHILDPKEALIALPMVDIEASNYGMDSMVVMELASNFNGESYQRDGASLVGSGAYKLKEWYTGNRIILERKSKWWGDAYTNENMYFKAFPDKIIYEIIKSWTQAIVALKKNQLDVARAIPIKDFMALKATESIQANYNVTSGDLYAYEYVGLNMKTSLLSDLNLRKAVSHLMPKEEILDVVLHGMGSLINTPFWACEEVYDRDIVAPEYNLEKAKSLLGESGWSDSDGDGILDKIIDGEKRDLKLTYLYNAGNSRRENIGIVFRENLEKAGIGLELIAKEWSVFLESLSRHEFDMFISGYSTSSAVPDPKQIFHTSSYYAGGSNCSGFGDAESDLLIDEIRNSVDSAVFIPKLKTLQKKIRDDIPSIFLYSLKNRALLNKRFNTPDIYINSPGYWEGTFELKASD